MVWYGGYGIWYIDTDVEVEVDMVVVGDIKRIRGLRAKELQRERQKERGRQKGLETSLSLLIIPD